MPCQISGMVSRARAPSESTSTGTRRHSATCRCCSTRLQAQKGLDAQRDREVEACLGIFEVEAGDLPDPLQAVAKRVRVDPQPLSGLLLLARLEVRAKRGDERAFPRAV